MKELLVVAGCMVTLALFVTGFEVGTEAARWAGLVMMTALGTGVLAGHVITEKA